MKNTLLLFCFFIIIINLFSQNNSLHFDGGNDRINGANSPLLEISNGTVELWVRPETKSTRQVFLCYRSSNGSQTRYLWNFLGNLNGLGFWNGSVFNTFNFSFNSGQWYHLAFVGEATQTKIYIDGVEEGVFPISFGTATGSSINLILGYSTPGTEYFNGELDEIRIWDRALSAPEINNAMSCELTGNEMGLVAYYDFNQGTAGGNNSSESILQDSSPNGLNGTLNNFDLTGTTSNWVASSNGVSGTCALLPLDLIDFDVYEENDKIRLSWVTENEIDFSHFEVYRSFDGQNWDLIGNINATGEIHNNYRFYDEFDANNILQYYKLKMVDFDASFDWSPVKVINLSGVNAAIRIFPNPVCSNGTLSIKNVDIENIKEISIIDVVGKKASFSPSQMNFNNSTGLILNIPNLENGIYLIRFEMKNGTLYQNKLIVMK